MKRIVLAGLATTLIVSSTGLRADETTAPVVTAPANTPSPTATPLIRTTLDLSTPAATVQSYVSALNRANLKEAATCVLGASANEPGLADLEKIVEQHKMTFKASNLQVTMQGDKAVCQLKLSMSGYTTSSTLHLTRQDARWKIVPALPSQISFNGPNVLWPIDSLYCIATFIRYPQVALQNVAMAQETLCETNLNTLFIAYRLYVTDYRWRKLKATTFKSEFISYIHNRKFLNDQTFHCPDDTGGHVSYSYNGNLKSYYQYADSDRDRIVLLYEGSNGKLNFRHNGYAEVLFLSGRTARVNQQQAKSLCWTTQAKPTPKLQG